MADIRREDLEIYQDGLMTVPEAVAFMRVSRSKIYNLMDSGQVPYAMIGRCRRLSKRALLEYLIKQTVRPSNL